MEDLRFWNFPDLSDVINSPGKFCIISLVGELPLKIGGSLDLRIFFSGWIRKL
jgi:hypothetical protein